MANEQITEFFREKTAKAEAIVAGIDWSARRDSWINAVGQLYATIEHDYLASAESAAYVQVDRSRTKTIQEPYIGNYSIPELLLTVGAEEVLFSPQGTIVYGAKGRIDVRGDRGEANLVRQDDDAWSLIVSLRPKLRLVPLDEDSFLEMLRDIMR